MEKEQRNMVCELFKQLIKECMDDEFGTVDKVSENDEYYFVSINGEIRLCELNKIAQLFGDEITVSLSDGRIELEIHFDDATALDLLNTFS